MGSIWHIGVAVPDLQKGRKELVVFSLGSPAACAAEELAGALVSVSNVRASSANWGEVPALRQPLWLVGDELIDEPPVIGRHESDRLPRDN